MSAITNIDDPSQCIYTQVPTRVLSPKYVNTKFPATIITEYESAINSCDAAMNVLKSYWILQIHSKTMAHLKKIEIALLAVRNELKTLGYITWPTMSRIMDRRNHYLGFISNPSKKKPLLSERREMIIEAKLELNHALDELVRIYTRM